MKCMYCGAEMLPDSTFCSACGAKNAGAAPEQPTYTAPVGGMLSEKEFYDRFMPKKSKSWVTALMVISFITAGLSLVLVLLGNILGLIDVAFYLVIGFLLLKSKKWGVALATVIYSGFWSLLGLITGGGLTGIVALIVGVMATIELKKFGKLYADYKISGQLPVAPGVVDMGSMKKF